MGKRERYSAGNTNTVGALRRLFHTNQGPSALGTNVKFLFHTFVVVVNFIRKRPSPYAGDRQSDTTEAAATPDPTATT